MSRPASALLLAIVRHQRNDPAAARRLCHRSYAVARAPGDALLAAEALNALGGSTSSSAGTMRATTAAATRMA
ncbi:MAG TPA: hypothetical protein VM716_14545 [Gemmatimonadales bacterium]|nr:hypothetical protein [Gemmatimonadales bacterium]